MIDKAALVDDKPSQPTSEGSLESLLGEVAGEFFDRMTSGERPEIDEYVKRYPEIAQQIRCAFPALQVVGDSQGDSGPQRANIDLQGQKTLGDFRILHELGRGGMGVVYEAEQLSMGRKVALKVLPFAAIAQEKSLKRFRNEVRAAGTLNHPSIVPIYSVGEERGVHFFAMQLIHGQTMAEVIAELVHLQADGQPLQSESISEALSVVERMHLGAGADEETEALELKQDHNSESKPDSSQQTRRELQARISTEGHTDSRSTFVRSAARLGVQAAEALQHAHDRGVLHRDIKPGNLMLDAHGQLYIADFGLAHVESDVGVTMTGDLVGTLRYMSPEQALAKRIVIDHRSDIYSLGVTLYELLTLRPPFDGEHRQELLKQIAFEDPPKPRQINRSIPHELETIVCKAIEKNPDERYATADELADDLRAFLEDRPIKAKPHNFIQRSAKWSRRHRPLVWSGGVSSALLLIIAVVLLAISNAMITAERNEKTGALTARTKALGEKEKALSEKDEALAVADANLKKALEAVDRMLTRVSSEELVDVPQMGLVRKTLLEDASEFYLEFLETNRDDPELRFATAQALVRVGHSYMDIGQNAKSEQALDHSLTIMQGLVQDYPLEGSYQGELANACSKLGNLLLWGLADPKRAEPLLRQAATLSRQLADKWPDEASYRAVGLNNAIHLAYALKRMGRQQESLEVLRQGITDAKQLVDDFPTELAYQREYAYLLMHLSSVIRADEPDEAEKASRQSIAIQQVVIVEDGEEAWMLVATQCELGALLQNNGRSTEAEDFYLEALALSDRLVHDFPHTKQNWLQRNNTRTALGRLYAVQGRLPDAESALRQSWESLQLEVARLPQLSQPLVDASQELVKILIDDDHTDEVERVLRSTIAVIEKAVTEFPAEEDPLRRMPWPGSRQMTLPESLQSQEPANNVESPGIGLEQPVVTTREETFDKLNVTLDNAKINLMRFLADSGSTVDYAPIIGEFEPSTATGFVQRGKLFEQYGDKDKAQADYSKAIELAPDISNVHMARGWMYMHAGKHEEALADFSSVLKLNFTYWQAQHGRGNTYLAMHEYQKAVDEESKVIELNPNFVDSYLVSRKAYHGLSEFEKERQGLVRATEINVTSASGYHHRGEIYYRLKQYDEALADYTRCLELDPNYGGFVVYNLRGDIYAEHFKQYDQALADYSAAIAATPKTWHPYKRRALTHFHLQNYDEALADIAKAIDLNATDVSNLTWISPSLAAKCPDQSFRTGLLEQVDRTIELTHGSASAYETSAAIHTTFGMHERARADLQELLKRKPESSVTWYHYAMLSLHLDEPDNYRGSCVRMAKHFADTEDGNDARWTAWTCAVLPNTVDNYDTCVRLAELAVSSDTGNSRHLGTLAAVLFRAGRYEEAARRLKETIDLWGDTLPIFNSPAYTWFFLAMAEQQLGHTDEAQKWLAKAVQHAERELANDETSWNRRATLELLRDEANALVATEKAVP